MAGIRVSVDIAASPTEVWKVVEPVERHVDWMHDAVAITFTGEQTRGVGTAFVCDTKVGPLRLADRMEITEWQPAQVMGVRHAGMVTGEGRFTLAAIADGEHTRFTWEETLHFPWWMGGPVGAFVGGKIVLAAIWRRNLKALRQLVETVNRGVEPGPSPA